MTQARARTRFIGFTSLTRLGAVATLTACALCSAGLASGCAKNEKPQGVVDAGAQVDAASTPDADAAASAASKKEPVNFAGTYAVSVGTMYVPDAAEFKSVKFKNDETQLLGEGKLTLILAPDDSVSGATDGGPLGAATIAGSVSGDLVTATLSRKDPTDNGLTGTLVGRLAASGIEGEMKLSEWNAAVVRQATFNVQRAPK